MTTFYAIAKSNFNIEPLNPFASKTCTVEYFTLYPTREMAQAHIDNMCPAYREKFAPHPVEMQVYQEKEDDET